MVRTSGGASSAAAAGGRRSERPPSDGAAAVEAQCGGRGAGARPVRFREGEEEAAAGAGEERVIRPIIPPWWLTK